MTATSANNNNNSYKLHTPEASFRALPTLIAAEYCGIDVEISTSMEGAKLSPTGKLPLLEIVIGTSVHRIFGAHSMAKYVAGTRPELKLLGGTREEISAVNQWMDFAASQLELPCCLWFYPVTGVMPFSADSYEKAKTDVAAALAIVEKHLAKGNKQYLVAERLTLADIVVVSTLLYPFKLVCEPAFLKNYPNVVKWFESCVALSEFVQVMGETKLCQKELLAPGQDASSSTAAAPPKPAVCVPKPAAQAPAPAATEEDETERRIVSIAITPVSGVDPSTLYEKIKSEIKSQPEYGLKWDDACKVENHKIYTSFTIAVEADFDEEVMEWIEMMEDEVANQQVTFQTVME